MKIASKFNLIAMSLISLTLLAVGATAYIRAKTALQLVRLEHLTRVADQSLDDIQSLIIERRADIKVVQGYFNIKTNLPILSQYRKDKSNPIYQRANKMLDEQLHVFYKAHRILGLMLLDKEGIVVYAANPEHMARELGWPLPDPAHKAFEEGRKRLYVSEVFKDKVDGFKFFITAPAYDFQEKFIGVIAFGIDLASHFQFLQDTEGLGQTVETLIGKRSDDALLFLNARRHESHANSIPNGLDQKESAFPMRQATQGKEGHGISIDYRGEEVLAVWKFVPELNLGLVAKIDMEETYAPITDLRDEILLIAMIIFSTTLLISTWLSKSLSRPLVKLTAFTKNVGSGDLTQLITVDSKDEVGQLATSFNEMVQSLSEAQETEMAQSLRRSEVQKNLLERSKERYQELVETLPYGIQEIDTKGTILFGSHAYHQILGYENGSLVGTNVRVLLLNEEFQGEKYLLYTRLSTQPEPGIYTEQHVKKDGTIIDLEIAWNYKQDSKGKVVGFISVVSDITKQKQLERERESLVTDLEIRNAEMERFTYTVSHDLKSPLITIGGYLHLVEKALSSGKTETVESDLYRIASAVATMEQLLTDLLSISSIGYASTPPQTIPLTQVAEEALAMVRGLLKDKDLQVKIEPNLPLATGDPIRIREVFTNLIENAVKFMGDQRAPCIKIGMRHNKGDAILCIQDNGIGIDPRYHENIFGLFNRLDKAIDGTGVGLALVKRIIEVHGGRIWVESEGDGQGSTFCFTLPGPSAA